MSSQREYAMGSESDTSAGAEPQKELVQAAQAQPEEPPPDDDPYLIPGIFRIRLAVGLQSRNSKWRSRRGATEKPGE